MSSSASIRQVVNIVRPSLLKSFIKPNSPTFITFTSNNSLGFPNLVAQLWTKRNMIAVCKASPAVYDDENGVSLGTMKLPSNIDIPRFETLLFQWGNSLSQGANVPLPAPLKVDKIPGGARLGFIDIGDGPTEMFVYIDCLVFPGTDGSAPIFRAIRNGPMKDQPPPGEPRIMRSMLEALTKCIQIATV